MSDDNTQLTTASGYNTNNMIFSIPQTGSIPNSIPPISFQRIMISTKNPDGTIGELIIPTERLFSFGVGENKNQETGKVNGYTLPICLHNRDGATKSERDWTDTFNNIVERVKEYLVKNREELGQFDLEMGDLKKFNPLYFKKEKGKPVEGSGPTLYAKLMVSKKHNKIVSMFFNKSGDPVDPMTLMGKYCYAKGAIKIESIFIGNKISLQVKLYEAEVELMQTNMKRLLTRPTSQPRVLTSSSNNPMNEIQVDEDYPIDNDNDNDGNGSLDEHEKHEEEKEPVKKPIRKITKKVTANKNK